MSMCWSTTCLAVGGFIVLFATHDLVSVDTFMLAFMSSRVISWIAAVFPLGLLSFFVSYHCCCEEDNFLPEGTPL